MGEVFTNVLKVAKVGKATKTALTTFDALNSVLKSSDLDAALIKPHASELVDAYCSLISRHADAKKLAEIALRSLGYFMYNTTAVAQLNEVQSERLLDTVINVIKTSESKAACNLAVWCIAIQQLRYAVGRRLPDILAAISGLIGTSQPRFASSTIEYESITAYGKLLGQIPESMSKQADSWVTLVCTRLLHENPTVREKAETIIKASLPVLLKNGIPATVSTMLVRELQEGMLERFNLFLDEESAIEGKDKPALAMRVWGYLVVLLQKELWTSGLIKSFLQIPSATFNHTDPHIRIATWEGWQYLMDNCTHDMAHLLRPKSKRTELLLKPYISSVDREQNTDVRRALLRSWSHMISSFGQSLPTVFTQVFFPFLEAVAKVPEKELVEEVLQFVAKLFALQSKQDTCDKGSGPEPLALEADWLVDNLALFILQILPPFIFKSYDALLDVWQGLIERVASLYAQDPESKRIASVLSQVVHFLSDILASGSSLSSSKEASVPLTYSSSLLTRFLQAFSVSSRPSNGTKASHHANHYRLSPSPHHALLSEAASPTAHASTSTLLGVLLSGLHCNINAVSDQKTFTEILSVLLNVTPATKEKQVNPNTSLLTALHVLQSLLESSSARKTNQKVLMMGWTCIARNLEERMEETNCAADVPFPFALPNKHDHRTVYYTALLSPLRAALQGDGQTSWTVLVDGTVGDIKKVWNQLYSTFFRISALKDEAEGCVEHMCKLLMDILRPGLRWNNGVGKIIEATKTIIDVAGQSHPFIIAAPATKTKSKQAEPSGLLKLLLRLFKAMSVFPDTLAQDEEYGHEYMKGLDAAAKQLMVSEWQLSLSYLSDTITSLFNKARGKAEVICLVSTFGDDLAKWLRESPVPPEATIALSRSTTTNVRKDLDKLFEVVAKSVIANYKPPYEAEAAKLLMPLLKEALVTKRKVLKNSAIQFWNSTFGTAPSLPDLPEELVALLSKLHGKVPIKLPLGWNGGSDLASTLATDAASMALDDDSVHVPTQIFPGSDDRPKFSKPAAPASADTGSSPSDASPRRIAKRRRSNAPTNTTPPEGSEEEKENDRRYVDAVNSSLAQKKRKSDKEELLTEHQLEVLERQRKEVKSVAFYNGLDQSSQDGSTFNIFASGSTSGSLFMPSYDDPASADPKIQAKLKADEAAKQRELEKEKERQRLERERKELEEKERQERENGKEKLRLRKRASFNWRKEQLLQQEKELDKDDHPQAPTDHAADEERTAKRRRVEENEDSSTKNAQEQNEQKNMNSRSETKTEPVVNQQQPMDNSKEVKSVDTAMNVPTTAAAFDLKAMLVVLCQPAAGGGSQQDMDAQIGTCGDLLARFSMQELFTAQDRLTCLLSAMTQQLRKRSC